jgi:hypothetical protein
MRNLHDHRRRRLPVHAQRPGTPLADEASLRIKECKIKGTCGQPTVNRIANREHQCSTPTEPEKSPESIPRPRGIAHPSIGDFKRRTQTQPLRQSDSTRPVGPGHENCSTSRNASGEKSMMNVHGNMQIISGPRSLTGASWALLSMLN